MRPWHYDPKITHSCGCPISHLDIPSNVSSWYVQATASTAQCVNRMAFKLDKGNRLRGSARGLILGES